MRGTRDALAPLAVFSWGRDDVDGLRRRSSSVIRRLRCGVIRGSIERKKVYVKKTIFVAVLATAAMSACVVAPVSGGHPYYAQPVMVAPPPPRVEYVGPPPVEGQIWISGFWNWSGNRHEWVPGRWESPRPGHAWVPHRWEQDGERWRLNGGHWEERRGNDRERRDEHREHHDWR